MIASDSHLPSRTKPSEGFYFGVGCFGEQLTVDHGVQQPFPVFPGNIRDKPWVAFAVEPDLFGQATLQ